MLALDDDDTQRIQLVIISLQEVLLGPTLGRCARVQQLTLVAAPFGALGEALIQYAIKLEPFLGTATL